MESSLVALQQILNDYRDKIKNANVYDVAIKSPIHRADGLSKRLGNNILLKREDLQPVHSFKLRGSYNKINRLSEAALQRGVITASAGNHAQGVALAAQRKRVPMVIVMPKTTPSIKVNSVREFGGDQCEIVLIGNTYDEAYAHAQERSLKEGLTFVHPYDDPEVIAGQATVGLEILEQCQQLDYVFVPVGGGGLLAGTLLAIKEKRPHVKVIAVEPHDAPSLYEAMKAGYRVVLDQVGIFADGVAVRQIGEETYRVVKDLVDDAVIVSTDEICAAIKDIFDDTRSICEPAGALAVAAVKNYVNNHRLQDKNMVCIASGANINFDRLRHVAERAELGEHREALFSTTIPERPGSFRRFCEAVGLRGITEFNYRYADPVNAHIFVGVQLRNGEEERQELLAHLHALEYAVVDLTDNEMAKMHIRYMVGGRGVGVSNERLFRFEFPERPGALLRFLDRMGERWNISLFHYRNHGAAYGRVLVGIQVPEQDSQQLMEFLQEVNYPYAEETENPAYKLFLGVQN